MSTYRLYPSNPVLPLVGYSGPFQSGIDVQVTQGGMWFEGYWWYVPAGGDIASQEFVLTCVTGNSSVVVVPGTDITSGVGGIPALVAGQWNYLPLATPIQIAIGTQYKAATGWTAVHGFPDQNNVYQTSGVTNGPLMAWVNGGPQWGGNQGSFGTGTAGSGAGDIKSNIPFGNSNESNFGIDVQVSDTAPSGFAGPVSLWPNNFAANKPTAPDAPEQYVIATEFTVSNGGNGGTLNAIRYWSPSGTSQLATHASIWTISTQAETVAVASPSWIGAAGSGWVQINFTGVTLPDGDYKVSVYNGNATPDAWSAKDASSNYWGTGVGASGITNGILSAPGLSTASLAEKSDMSGTERGQCTFANLSTGPNQYPNLYVDGLAQNYWVDVVVTPVVSVPATITGAVATMTFTAPAGSVSAGASIAGAVAGIVLAAPTGAVHAGSSVAGVTAHIVFTAPVGTASASSGTIPALDPMRLGGSVTSDEFGGGVTGTNIEDYTGEGYGGYVTGENVEDSTGEGFGGWIE